MTFRVFGIPIPQGSMRGFIRKGKKKGIILTSANTKTEPWRQDVAAQAIKAGISCIERGPVELHITFFMPHPVSRAKKHWAPDVRPDLDKLVRAVLDALTSIAWRDDSQVCAINASKVYEPRVGADITVAPMVRL